MVMGIALIVLCISTLTLIIFSIYTLSSLAAAAEYTDKVYENPVSTYALVLTSFALSVSLGAIIPYFISTSTIRSEAKAAVGAETRDLGHNIRKIEVKLDSADAHLSRMTGYQIKGGRSTAIWSVGWSYRSVKRYSRVISEKPHYIQHLVTSYSHIVHALNVTLEGLDAQASDSDAVERAVCERFGVPLTDPIDTTEKEEREDQLQRIYRACKDAMDSLIMYESKDISYPWEYADEKSRIERYHEDVIKPFCTLCISVIVRNERESSPLDRTRIVNKLSRTADYKDECYKRFSRLLSEVLRKDNNIQDYTIEMKSVLRRIKG